jgi:hypothetical protein
MSRSAAVNTRAGWWAAVLVLSLMGCPEATPGDGGTPTGGGGGGGGDGTGAGSGVTGGASGLTSEEDEPLPVVVSPEYFDAGALDNTDKKRGCIQPAIPAANPECDVAATGCRQASDCPNALCLRTATGGVCTKACSTTADCEPTWHCETRWTGAGRQGFCAPNGGLR